MRLHSDIITTKDLYEATRAAGPRVYLMSTPHGSRQRDHAFEVHLRGTSKRHPNSGRTGAGDEYAATWDEWGIFFGHLFRVDPDMVAARAYAHAGQFNFRTFERFADAEVPEDMHGDHTFRYHAPYVQKCTKCTARFTWQP